jgi:hypothetical protein
MPEPQSLNNPVQQNERLVPALVPALVPVKVVKQKGINEAQANGANNFLYFPKDALTKGMFRLPEKARKAGAQIALTRFDATINATAITLQRVLDLLNQGKLTKDDLYRLYEERCSFESETLSEEIEDQQDKNTREALTRLEKKG